MVGHLWPASGGVDGHGRQPKEQPKPKQERVQV